jgi:hypothetical protein
VLTPTDPTEIPLQPPEATIPAPKSTARTWALVIFVMVFLLLMLVGGIAVFAALGAQDVGGCGGG